MIFSAEQITQLNQSYAQVSQQYQNTLIKITTFSFKTSDSREYAVQGFARRFKILKRCIENIYRTYPPENKNKPNSDELSDLNINLHSFVFNVFGCIDNLAWIWVKENNFQYSKNTEVTFSNKKIRALLSEELKNYFTSTALEKWFKNLNNFRHALAHRIPLYVPPFVLNPSEQDSYEILEKSISNALISHDLTAYSKLKSEQNSLGTFMPWMTHSFSEKTPVVVFHPQIIADWNTVIEILEKVLQELSNPNVNI